MILCNMLLTLNQPWFLMSNMSADRFIVDMLGLGQIEELTVVAAQDTTGRGSRQDIDLPLHHDGDYSARKAAEKGIPFDKTVDIVGLYCLKGGGTVTTLEWPGGTVDHVLETGQCLVFDNKICRHGRKGSVGDRVLLRAWIKRKS